MASAEGSVLGRLANDRASSRECGADLPREHRGGKVPWRDEQRDSDRLVHHEHPVLVRRRDPELPRHADCFFGEPAKELGRVGDLAPRIRKYALACLLGDDEQRQFL